ncbi:MlaD family protein [Candidatus Similichlamydia laticola]|uniref:Putative ABC transporter, periplasmic substrate-binding protein n=1 Tax=Candidatus Similichlamydia laticola TaxID=2170265 RepID=A0A369KFF7_9BACT|nr:MlaD family protein [Candidatus Similichlamydia laticola]RDB31637.1 putative ABC transporter, periplasmic substrate-binding protein [Candidatus Similichlamydia laticola]
MREGTRNTLVGLFIVSGTFILLSLALFLRPNLGDGKRILRVRFHEIDRLAVGSRVCFAGKSIGRIVDVQYVPDCRYKSRDSQGRIYPFELTLSVDSVAKILKTDEIFAHNIGLLGERVVFIRPIQTNQPIEETQEQEVFWAQPSVDFEEVLAHAHHLLEKIQVLEKKFVLFLEGTNTFLQTFDLTAQAIDFPNLQEKISSLIQLISDKVLDHEVLQEVQSAARQITSFFQSIQETLIYLSNIEGMENSLLSESLRLAQQIVEGLNSGQGTLGKLLQSDEAHRNLLELFEQATQLVEGIKKYGVFFQNNREWKRLLQEQERVKRLQQTEKEQTEESVIQQNLQ